MNGYELELLGWISMYLIAVGAVWLFMLYWESRY
jgi:hypothetical protein